MQTSYVAFLKINFKIRLDINMKFCKTCNNEKDETEFYRSNNRKDGLSWECKECNRERSRKWSHDNPDKVKLLAKEWRKKKPEYSKIWYQEHKDEESIKNKIRYMENPDKYCIKAKKWHQENLERSNEYRRLYSKVWRQSHLEKSCNYRKDRYRREKLASGEFTEVDFDLLKHKYNYTCLCCGKAEPNIKLVADHVVPLSLGGNNNVENRQPLCVDCNRKKNAKTIDYRNNYNIT